MKPRSWTGLLALIAVIAGVQAVAQQQYPLVKVQDLQRVTDFTIRDDDSPMLGDTIRVEVVAAGGPRSLSIGARWAFYAYQDTVDENGQQVPYTGVMIIQHDTTETGTLMNAVQPGDKIVVTCVVEEYPSSAGTISQTQLSVLTDPPVPIDFVGAVDPQDFPKPVVVPFAELDSLELGEQWEGALVRAENVVVVNNQLSRGTNMLVEDASGRQVIVDDQYMFFRRILPDGDGSYSWPPPGTHLNIVGHVRDIGDRRIEPRTFDDIELITNPPVITDWTRSPAAPNSSDAVTVSAQITDNGTVDSAYVVYSVDDGPFATAPMASAPGDSIFSGTIPAQNDGAFVKYYLRAVDNDGEVAVIPDTSTAMLFYVVRDAGLGIYDLQWSPFTYTGSGYEGLEVTVTGIAVSDSTHFPGEYVLMDAAEPWHGILVRDGAHALTLGDEVRVTATVQESYGMTRLNYVTDFQLLSVGNDVPGPILVHTADIMTGSPTAESYEGCFVEVRDLAVTDPFPDAPNNYGEFVVDDGSGAVRVDDSGNFRGNLDSTFAAGDHIDVLRGVLYYTFGNYKIEPRDDGDVVGHTTGVEPEAVSLPRDYELSQNYPNPFNPATSIRFVTADAGHVRLDIFNVLGQRVRTLLDAEVAPGVHKLQWDGLDDAGKAVAGGVYLYRMRAGDRLFQKKMLLLK